MPRGPSSVVTVLPFVPFLAGLALSTWRFQLHDGVGGLAFGLGGAITMIVIAVLLPGAEAPSLPARARSPAGHAQSLDTVPR